MKLYEIDERNMKNMRRTILILGILLTLMIASSAMSAPRLTLPESVFDFGYVPQNSKISHIFWLHSTGDDSLKILRIIPG